MADNKTDRLILLAVDDSTQAEYAFNCKLSSVIFTSINLL